MRFRTQAGVLVVLFALAAPAAAQQPPAPRGPQRPDSAGPRMLNVEAALRMKQELKLSEAQVSQLETVRKEIVAQRQAEARDRIDLQSRLAAGLVSREDVLKQVAAKRDAMRQTMEQRHDRVARILTPDQQQQLGREMRHMMMERMFQRRGGRMRPGGMGWRRPGMMGPRMRPGMGRGFMRPRFGPGGFGPGFEDDSSGGGRL